MRDLGHHAADGRRIRPLNDLVQPGEAQTTHHPLMSHRRADCRTYVFEPQGPAGCCLFGRHHNSSAVLPRMPATASLFFSFFRASKVALTTLCGFVVPMDFVSTFCTPAEVI